jgi:5'-methylthioadenosine phosphorylase
MGLLGIIGGSGLYDIGALQHREEVFLETPFGEPSDGYQVGVIAGQRVAFLSRHGRQHRLAPHEINYRANVHGFKQLHADRLISISAVGSMRETIKPGAFVIVDQFVDITRARKNTFFEGGAVAHCSIAEPVCERLSRSIFDAASQLEVDVQFGGSYLCIDGPQFSTRAESRIYRQWGVDVIGMTNATEARLAREASLCYACVAMSTDFDCWHAEHAAVSVEAVLRVLQRNVAVAKQLVEKVVPLEHSPSGCRCAEALRSAMVTTPAAMSSETRDRLAILLPSQL